MMLSQRVARLAFGTSSSQIKCTSSSVLRGYLPHGLYYYCCEVSSLLGTLWWFKAPLWLLQPKTLAQASITGTASVLFLRIQYPGLHLAYGILSPCWAGFFPCHPDSTGLWANWSHGLYLPCILPVHHYRAQDLECNFHICKMKLILQGCCSMDFPHLGFLLSCIYSSPTYCRTILFKHFSSVLENQTMKKQLPSEEGPCLYGDDSPVGAWNKFYL